MVFGGEDFAFEVLPFSMTVEVGERDLGERRGGRMSKGELGRIDRGSAEELVEHDMSYFADLVSFRAR